MQSGALAHRYRRSIENWTSGSLLPMHVCVFLTLLFVLSIQPSPIYYSLPVFLFMLFLFFSTVYVRRTYVSRLPVDIQILRFPVEGEYYDATFHPRS
jgi:hypothetical protein